MDSVLTQVVYYVSPTGGAAAPRSVHEGNLVVEIITAGSVYSPGHELCSSGWIFCHGPGQHTIWQSDSDAHYECLTLDFELPPNGSPLEWTRSFHWGDTESVMEFAHEALHAFHLAQLSRQVLGEWIWSLLRYKMECYKVSCQDRAIPGSVKSAVIHLEKHFRDDISLTALAGEVGLSISYLHNLFKKHVDLSPHQYVIKCRMREARRLLVMTQAPIKAIAGQIGYVNAESFCRTFKQHAGITAATYREKYAHTS